MTNLPRTALLAICLLTLGGCRRAASSPTGPEPVAGESSGGPAIYVAIDGDDRHDGRSPESALRTIETALEKAAPGLKVVLLPGIYSQSVDIGGRACRGRPLHIEGRGGVVLDGGRELRFGFLITDCEDVFLENLEIRNYTDFGVGVYYGSRVVLRRLVVHHNGFFNQDPEFDGEGFGIDVEESSDVTVEDNETFANGPQPSVRAQGIFGTGINTYGNRDIRIRGNFSHHNIGGGLLVEDSVGVVVEDNRIEENDLDASQFNWWDGGLWLDGGSDVVVRRNTFRGNLGPGIQISDEEDRGPSGYVLEGNVSTGNYFGIYIWNFGVCPFPSPDVLRREGNQFAGNSRQDVWCEER